MNYQNTSYPKKSFGGDSYETIQPIQTWKNDDDYMIIGSCLY